MDWPPAPEHLGVAPPRGRVSRAAHGQPSDAPWPDMSPQPPRSRLPKYSSPPLSQSEVAEVFAPFDLDWVLPPEPKQQPRLWAALEQYAASRLGVRPECGIQENGHPPPSAPGLWSPGGTSFEGHSAAAQAQCTERPIAAATGPDGARPGHAATSSSYQWGAGSDFAARGARSEQRDTDDAGGGGWGWPSESTGNASPHGNAWTSAGDTNSWPISPLAAAGDAPGAFGGGWPQDPDSDGQKRSKSRSRRKKSQSTRESAPKTDMPQASPADVEGVQGAFVYTGSDKLEDSPSLQHRSQSIAQDSISSATYFANSRMSEVRNKSSWGAGALKTSLSRFAGRGNFGQLSDDDGAIAGSAHREARRTSYPEPPAQRYPVTEPAPQRGGPSGSGSGADSFQAPRASREPPGRVKDMTDMFNKRVEEAQQKAAQAAMNHAVRDATGGSVKSVPPGVSNSALSYAKKNPNNAKKALSFATRFAK